MYAAPLIVIMRHAEKPTATMRGVTETGRKDRHSLTVRGWQRAGALVHLLAPFQGSVQSNVLATPGYLFASSSLIVPDKANSSQREWQTLAPLSERLNIRINLKFDVDHRIAELAGYVPGKHRIPKKWPSKRYDLMYVFTRLANGTEYSFQQLAQPLLGDDRSTTLSNAG